MKIGILGGGQLARMLALAGYPLGLRCVVLDPNPQACAGAVTKLLVGAYDDPALLAALADQVEVATFDFENVPLSAARFLAERLPLYPPVAALAAAQDRLHEKTLFRQLGIPTAPFVAVTSWDDLQTAVTHIGLPAVLKTRRFGYDGKGQWVLRQSADVARAWQALSSAMAAVSSVDSPVPLILEGFVPFDKEVALIAVRHQAGDCAFYPLVTTVQQQGILRQAFTSSASQGDPLTQQAHDYLQRLLTHLQYVGVLTVEFFVQDGQLIGNEMAPRVHNSGHWTIEGAHTSQFENHLRALMGWPLGSTDLRGQSALINLLGELPAPSACLALPGVHWHDYGKSPQVGRKVGHVTLCDDEPIRFQKTWHRLQQIVGLSTD